MSNRIGIVRAPLFALMLTAFATAQTAAAANVKVQYHNGHGTGATSNQLAPQINLFNTSSSAITLSTVTIRYWFTVDTSPALSYFCDYTPKGCANVTSKFVKMSTATSSADT